ncbi:MAG: C40 family peptidase [Crocinitomicaceae bacterium]|nr:C40 family peptidase [Crocinitomicaceae bacterium]
MLQFEKFGICQVPSAPIRSSASDASEIVSQLLLGELVEVLETGRPWIKIKVSADGYEGYMDFKQLIYLNKEDYDANINHTPNIQDVTDAIVKSPNGMMRTIIGSSLPFYETGKFKLGNIEFEVQTPVMSETKKSIVETAKLFLNTPYLWGGRSIHGIDCSGFTQIVAKLHGYQLPRDASQQVHIGEEIKFEDRQPGDFEFYINSKGTIHHVGIIIEDNKVLHASGWLRCDVSDEKGIFREDFGAHTHQHHSIRRPIK